MREPKDELRAINRQNKITKPSETTEIKQMSLEYDNFFDTGEFEQAIKGYEKILEICPDDIETLYKKGQCLYLWSEHEEALNSFKKIIQLKPNYAECYCNIGLILELHLNDPSGAVENYEKAVKIDPNLEMAYFRLAEYYYYKHKYSWAIDNYTKSINCISKQYRYMEMCGPFSKSYQYFTRGQCYYYNSEFEKAESDYLKAIQLEPQDYKPYLTLGMLDYNKRRYEKALEWYNKGIEICNVISVAYFDRALVYWYGFANSENALNDLALAIKLDPHDTRFYELRGDIFIKIGKTELAKEVFKTALKINPSLTSVSIKLAQIERK